MNIWQLPKAFQLESQQLTIELFEQIATTAVVSVVLIRVTEWLVGGWYSVQMHNVPVLAVNLAFYAASYILASVVYLANLIYPRTPLTFTVFVNWMQLTYLILFPFLLPTMLISPAPEPSPDWRALVFASLAAASAVGISVVLFRTEMLIHGLGVGRLLLAQLPKLPAQALVMALLVGTQAAWSTLPPGIRSVIETQTEAVWKIVSEF